MHGLRVPFVLALLCSTTAAQLSDLQPGSNYPIASQAFGAGRSENLDVGDVDRDGDLDVAVANGGDGAGQDNGLYLNQGGLQGGTQGTFADVTATHLAGQIPESSRDIELVDWDGDFDLDLFDANRGTVVNFGTPRAYLNQGGLQLGSLGVFVEAADQFWGSLGSIPLQDEIGPQDGFGPFEMPESADADFADLDDDGDLDLMLSATGPNLNGTRPTLLFLNDGTGRFDELWPWVNAGADINLHTLDVDVVDLDNDFDLDLVASSRDSQSRIYRNNLAEDGWAGDPFTDVTQTALIDTGSIMLGSNCYEVEFADVDGDDDFDLWMVDYDGFSEAVLINRGGLEFFKSAHALKGDPNVDVNELDFLDYDNDGDLDAFHANFSGTNYVWQGTLAQGFGTVQGLFHRNGTSSGGSLATWSETPFSSNGGTTLDSQAADMDGDGDQDLLLANDGNQANRYWENLLGVPDTHAPVLRQLTIQGDKLDGSPTPIHVRVMDNASSHQITVYDARLVWSVDGGPETCWPMLCQGSQIFRGVIPGGLTGTVSYRVEVTDDGGNQAVTPNVSYQQSGGLADVWLPVDCGTVGVSGRPLLVLEGSGVGGQPVSLQLVDGAPSSLCLFVASLSSTPVVFKGGLLYPVPWDVELFLTTDTGGMVNLLALWPAGLPVGTETWFQFAIADPVHPDGATLSNAVRGTQP